MATLALSLAGQMVGGAIGGPIGATIGRALGALAGSVVDDMLFGETSSSTTAGSDIRLQGSSQGAAVPRIYGWTRLSGNIIWASELEQYEEASSGSKGGSSSTSSESSIVANFAVGLCEGEVHRLGRIWADGDLLDTSGLTIRFYRGTETQTPDSLIEAVQGEGSAPAYRGLCYLVFERLPLEQFGNRIPSISVELCRVVGELEPAVKAVTMIPGATEFGYDPTPRVRLVSAGVTAAENTHLNANVSDWTLSLDELTALCPNLEHVSLVVTWFGNDLRCGECAVAPRVEAANRSVSGTSWSVAGLHRGDVEVVSTVDGGPAYGGTPSDGAVLAAIADLKARGLGVTLYPLLMMDIPADNTMGQPAYPWRGRISCSDGVDGTATAATEIATFAPAYRSFILHYAGLAEAAGGVDALLIGSEMRGLTTVRDDSGAFPFVDALVELAADVRSVMGPETKLTYGADWSEYSGYQPGGGEKFFPLDPLWASDDIDAVGIDNYMPLADWRDGKDGLDAAEWDSIYDRAYLDGNVEGGEGFDWYYASDSDRVQGIRTPITDGAYGEPWVWRFKDIASWWSNAHHDRSGGLRSTSPTAWVPASKPIWLTELGCAAVDKGANQPNIFVDAKSSESGAPHFSNGSPDALMQRQALRTVLAHWADSEMVERIYVWTWDARPYPAFPLSTDVWSDGVNYATGHWLNGRVGGMASDELLRAIAADFDVTLAETEAAPPFVHGYVVSGATTARDAMEPLLDSSGLTVSDSAEGLVIARSFDREPVVVDNPVYKDDPIVSRRRPDPGESVRQVLYGYVDRERDYLSGTATAIAAEAGVVQTISTELVMDGSGARQAAELGLLKRLAPTDTIDLVVPPSMLALEAGDTIEVAGEPFEITEVRDGLSRRISARAIPPRIGLTSSAERPVSGALAPTVRSEPVVAAAYLPPATDNVLQTRLMFGAYAQPWPGRVSIAEESSGTAVAELGAYAYLGELTAPLAPGNIYLWDERNAPEITLYAGHLVGRSDDEVLAGANRIAIETDAGDWEVIGFAEAELIAPRTYRLAHLLRGQNGTDHAIGAASIGNRVVVLDSRPTTVAVPATWLGATIDLRAYAGSSDAEGQALSLEAELAPILPLTPVHLAASRAPSGDVTLNWVRRSRSDPDSWATEDAPLDYSPEAYVVSIYSGASLVRSIDCSLPEATYSAANQTTDFGSLPASFTFEVAQKSALYGPGHAAEGEFNA